MGEIPEDLIVAMKKHHIQINELLDEDEKEENEAMMREMMKNMFGDLDIDFDDFDLSKMHDPEFMEQFKQKAFEQQQKEKEGEKHYNEKKKNASTDIDFQKLYKKLVKLAHPDLSKSDDEKHLRDEQMKQLTQAWEKRDYYELLMAWLEIDPTNSIGLELTEANQKKLIRQLNEKIKGIENDTWRMKEYNQETAFYYKNFNAVHQKTIDRNIQKYKDDLLITTIQTKNLMGRLKNNKELKKFLKELKQDQEHEDEFGEFINSMFDKFK